MGLWEWTSSVLASTAGAAAALSIVAYAARTQLSHWLSRDLEATKNQYAHELEALKVAHQRELEAYKVSLIAETERVKAKQDVRKTGALRILERRFKCLEELHHASSGLYAALITHCQNTPGKRKLEDSQKMLEVVRRMGNAIEDSRIFMNPEETDKLTAYRAAILKFLKYLPSTAPAYPDNEEGKQLSDELMDAELVVDELIREHIDAMQALD